VIGRSFFVVAATQALAACGSAPSCPDDKARAIESEATSGTATLTFSGESAEQHFHVTIAGLPEVWPSARLLHEPVLTTSVVERFTEGEPGGDGQTPMPVVVTAFGSEPAMNFPSYPHVPGEGPFDVRTPLFDCWREPEGPCCRYGVTECSFSATLFVTRVDGADFGPVSVDWQARANVSVTQCPMGSSPTVELVPEAEP
jgi:hypothetical protein